MAGWMLVAALLLACHTRLAPRFFLFASFGLYFLYFGQLFCDSKHGGHGSLLMPSVLLLLALSGGPNGSPWSLVFIKIFIGVVYFAGGVSKLVVSFLFGQRWCGSTMQAYVFDAMWSRPHRFKLVRKLQVLLLTRWWACTGLALGGLVFELGFLPAVLLGGRLGAAVAAAVALGFHVGVDVLQGLDFMPFWCPVFWAFLPDLQGLLYGLESQPEEAWTAILMQGFQEEPCRWLMSAAYVGLQVLTALFFMDLGDREVLPLTCCPMFAMPRNLFGKEVRGGLLCDFDLRHGGHIDFSYNYLPWLVELCITEKELARIPDRCVLWMSSRNCHPLLRDRFQAEFLDKELLVCANYPASAELLRRVADLVSTLEEADAGDWSNPERVTEVLSMQAECQALFADGQPQPLQGRRQALEEKEEFLQAPKKVDSETWLTALFS